MTSKFILKINSNKSIFIYKILNTIKIINIIYIINIFLYKKLIFTIRQIKYFYIFFV